MELKYKRLDKPIPAAGLICMSCNNPIDTKNTTTMLCRKCSRLLAQKTAEETCMRKYGVTNVMHSKQFVDKIQDTMKERYGVNCAMNVPEFRSKFEETCKSKYGTSYYVNSDQFVQLSSCKSVTNANFVKLLEENGFQCNQEKVLDDKRFDIEIVGMNILIEIDPTYTHNVAGSHWDPKGHPKDKQLVKTLIAEKYGYRCIHVFDWDDWNGIIDLIRKPEHIIYARKCEVRPVTDSSFDNFIVDNHIQGQCKGTKVALGLYHNAELVEVMTFGKPRYNKNYQWELLRLCTKKELNVVGGASKLFKYATNKLNMTSIISYCDKSKFKGSVYSNIGMTFLRNTTPQEIWSKGKNKITGSLLRQRGYDQLFDANYGKGTSNEQLMMEHGWLPVFDCGQSVYTFGQPISKLTDSSESNQSIDYNAILKSIDKSKEKLCAFCNQPFVPRSSYQRYCKRPHYMNCPVCGKQYLVTNNENLKRPPVACSYACRRAKANKTCLEKYGTSCAANGEKQKIKARQTMVERYGAEYTFQSLELKERAKQTMVERYGADHPMHIEYVPEDAAQLRKENWNKTILQEFPLKMQIKKPNQNLQPINEDEMRVYMLKDKECIEFLKENGNRIEPKWGKIHKSLGLVKDQVIYQVLRFEKSGSEVVLADFGTKEGYYNPNLYTLLLDTAISVLSIDSFKCAIPRSIASLELTYSLSLELMEKGMYSVYWILDDNKVKRLTVRDNISEMKERFDYFTTDYLDIYQYKRQEGRHVSLIDEINVLN